MNSVQLARVKQILPTSKSNITPLKDPNVEIICCNINLLNRKIFNINYLIGDKPGEFSTQRLPQKWNEKSRSLNIV